MPLVSYVDSDGNERTVELHLGQSVMEGAVTHGIQGVVGDCGGMCACSTCHVYIDDAWLAACGEPSELEEGMLDFAIDVQANSRLSCQIRITEDLDGMVVRLPDKQF